MFFTNIRNALGMLEPASLRRWLLNVPLSFAAAVVEMATAAAIFSIIAVLNGTARAADLPVLGRLIERFPATLRYDGDGVHFLLVVTGLLVLVKVVLAIATTVYQQGVIARDRAALATRMYEGYLRAPYAFHIQRNVSDCVYRIDDAVKVVFETVLGGAANLLHSGLMIAGLMAMLLWANPWATLTVGLVLAGWVYVSVRVTQRALMKLGREADVHYRDRHRVLWEGLSALREVKIFGREGHFRDKFAQLQEALVRFYSRTGVLYVVPQVLLEGAFSAGMLLAMAILLATGSEGHATLPILGLYAYVGVRLIPITNIVIVMTSQIVAATVPLDLLRADFEATRLAPEVTAAPPPRLPFREDLAMEGVSFRYAGGSRLALRDVSLHIRRGESLAVVGKNGAGKSTLMHLLFGLLSPTTGRVLVDGVDIAGVIGSWHRLLGYVPQSVYLVEDSIARNVAFGVPADEMDRDRVRTVLAAVSLDAFADALPGGIDTLVGGSGVRLSGGQTQRIAIARALYHDPEVLLLDEASAALDHKVESDMAAAIAALSQTKTLIVIAHRPSTIRRCSRIALLHDGELVATGTYEEMFERSQEFRDILGSAESPQVPAGAR